MRTRKIRKSFGSKDTKTFWIQRYENLTIRELPPYFSTHRTRTSSSTFSDNVYTNDVKRIAKLSVQDAFEKAVRNPTPNASKSNGHA